MSYNRATSLTNPGVNNATAPQKIMLDMRRKRAMELRVEGLTLDQIRNQILLERDDYLIPSASYSVSNVLYDIQQVLSAMHKDMVGMAEHYARVELEKLVLKEQRMMRTIDLAYSKMELMDADTDVYEIKQILDTIAKMEESLIKVMDQRAKYLPIYIQKGNAADTSPVSSLETFLAAKKQAEARS